MGMDHVCPLTYHFAYRAILCLALEKVLQGQEPVGRNGWKAVGMNYWVR